MAIPNVMRVLAIAGTLAGGPAMADVQGQATASKRQISLFDLDLGHAMTPSLHRTYLDTPFAMDATVFITATSATRTGAERYAFLSLSTGATAWPTPVSAVPEPASWAMLPNGAFLLGRRLRTTARPAH